MNTLPEQAAVSDGKLRQSVRYFYWLFNLRTEGLSFFVVVPFVLLYVWNNIQFTAQQLSIFSRIWPPAFLFGIVFVLVNNWIVLIPVMRYFRKLLRGEDTSREEYDAARKRFLMLPYLHAAGAFFRWVLLLGNAIVAMMIMGAPARPQIVNMWTGAGICAVLGVFSYFSITEAHVQDLLNRGLFSKHWEDIVPASFRLLPRLTLMTIGASLLPAAIVFTLFYITVETHNLASTSMYLRIFMLILLGLFAGTISPFFLNKTIRGKVRIVRDFLDRIGEGNLDSRPGNVVIEDEISQINHSVDGMREKLRKTTDDLRSLNLTLEEKVEERTEELQATMEELEAMNENLVALNEELEEAYVRHQKDLQMAANVQGAFFPDEAPDNPEYDIAFISRPMSVVSGDFIDFYTDEKGRLTGTGIFDVSGHGISSGLLTILAKSVIQKNFHRFNEEKMNTAIKKINRELIEEIGQTDKYLTGLMLRFREDVVEYCNCGHPDAFFRVSARDRVGRIVNREGESIKGMFLGIADMDAPYEVLSLRLQKGDCLFLFSDCFIESVNIDGETYSEEHIKNSLRTAAHGSALSMLDHLLYDFDVFLGNNKKLQDDLTAMVIVKK